MQETTVSLAKALGKYLLEKHLVVGTAESCTGGLVSATITDVPGSSQWYDCSFITYTNQAKIQSLGVDPLVLKTHGAVSEEVAAQMAQGVIKHAPLANVAVSTTGVAGPDGGTQEKPVGMVCFGFSKRDEQVTTYTYTQYFKGNRQEVREQAVEFALSKLMQLF